MKNNVMRLVSFLVCENYIKFVVMLNPILHIRINNSHIIMPKKFRDTQPNIRNVSSAESELRGMVI